MNVFRYLGRVGVGLALVNGFALGSPVRAQGFLLTEIRREPGGAVVVGHQSRGGAYYLLRHGVALSNLATTVAAGLGADGTGVLRHATAPSGSGFYRVLELPVGRPIDTDGDGIDDVYELRRPGDLNPLDPGDAGRDPDGNGLTFLEEYLNSTGTPTRVAKSSPSSGEADVAVTRETILWFDRPLAAGTVLTRTNLYAIFGGRELLGRVELSGDRTKATLFYQENLPASARVRVVFDAAGVLDASDREVDADGDGKPGGLHFVDFDTLGIAPLPATAVIGRVYASEPLEGPVTSTNRPLAGVTITVDGAEETLRTTTDAEGFFTLTPVPAGRFFVHVDGRTAVGSDWPNGAYYPFVGKAWEAVAGVRTNLAGGNGEIFLPLIPAGALRPVSATEETTIGFAPETLAERPSLAGVEIRVPANSLFSDNGVRGGRVGIAPVAPDRLPEPLPPGLELPLVITVQTDGPANFDQPVPVRFPNLPHPVTGVVKEPGEKSTLWSFSHDTGKWEIVGSMTVSADGKFVESDPGVGITQPGWHGEDPACRGEGDIGLSGGKQAMLMADVTWNMMQGGANFAGLASDLLGAAPGIGNAISAFNAVLDVGACIKEPNDPKNWLKLGANIIGAIPGIGNVATAAKAVAFGLDVIGTGEAAGNLIKATQNNQSGFNDCYGTGRSEAALHRGRVGKVVVTRTVRGPDLVNFAAQAAAAEDLQARLQAYAIAGRTRLPILDDMIRLHDRMLPVARRITNEAPAFTLSVAEREALLADAIRFTNRIGEWRARGDFAKETLELFRAYDRYLSMFERHLAYLSVPEARGSGSDAEIVLRAFYDQKPLSQPVLYRLTGGGIERRGKATPDGKLELIMAPDTVYRLQLLDPVTLAVGDRIFVSEGNARRFSLAPLLLAEMDASPDSDGDGLRDFAEQIVGTRADRVDTDGDGVVDGAEVQNGGNPLDNAVTTIGWVGTTPLSSAGRPVVQAQDICADGTQLYVATGPAGLVVLRHGGRENPVVVAQVDTPGDARRVSCDRGFVAVADGPAGLAIVDISDLPASFVAHQLTSIGEVQGVAAGAGVAFAGTQGGLLVAVHLASGTELARVHLGAPVVDVQLSMGRIHALVGTTIRSFDFLGDDFAPFGAPITSGSSALASRLVVAGGLAYVVHHVGYRVFDLSDPESPRELTTSGDTTQRGWKQIVPTGSGLGVAAVSPNLSFDGPHDVSLYDLRDPSRNDRFLAQFETPGVARSVALHRGLAYVADHDRGVQVLNFLATDLGTNAPSLSLAASFPLSPARVESGRLSAVLAEAGDDVLVRDVEFYVDHELAHADGSYPFEFNFFAPTLDTTRTAFVLRVKATDTGGNVTWSPEITVELLPDQTPPRARPAAPAANGFTVSPTSVGVLFNEPIDPSTLDAERLTLVYLGPDRLAGTADDVRVVGEVGYAPESRLAELRFEPPGVAGRFLARLAGGVADVNGNVATNEVVWAFEVVSGTDADGDGLLDDFEIASGMNPNTPDQNGNGLADSFDDFDGDGLSNGMEMLLGTNPRNARTFDGILDRELDRDGDWLTDVAEFPIGSDRLRWDTDGDGWNDEIEVATGDSPLRPNAYLRGVHVGSAVGHALRLEGPQFRSAQGDVLRLGDGQVVQSTATANVLRLGGPNELGHSIVSATPLVRLDPSVPPGSEPVLQAKGETEPWWNDTREFHRLDGGDPGTSRWNEFEPDGPVADRPTAMPR